MWFSAPSDPAQEMPYEFALFGGQGIARHDQRVSDKRASERPVPRRTGGRSTDGRKGHGCLNYRSTSSSPPLPRRSPGPRGRIVPSEWATEDAHSELADVLRKLDPGCERDRLDSESGWGSTTKPAGQKQGTTCFTGGPPENCRRRPRRRTIQDGPTPGRYGDSRTVRGDDERVTFGSAVAFAKEAGRAELPDVARGSPTNSTRSVPSPPGPTSRPDAWAPAVPSGKREHEPSSPSLSSTGKPIPITCSISGLGTGGPSRRGRAGIDRMPNS